MELGIGSMVRINIDFDIDGTGEEGRVVDVMSLKEDGTPEIVSVEFKGFEGKSGNYYTDTLDILSDCNDESAMHGKQYQLVEVS